MPAKSKCTPELLSKFEELVENWDPFKYKADRKILSEFSDLGYQHSIAFHLEISRPRVRDYKNKYPEFKEIYEKWLQKRDHYFTKLAEIYLHKDKNNVQWIWISKNILGWSDQPTSAEDDDNSIPDLIKAIQDSAKKIEEAKKSGSKK